MRDCVASRLRLPNLYWIWIDYISDADADLASFLSDCIPSSLHLFTINYHSISNIGIKSKFYVKAFSEVARRTTKEVFFYCIDFSAKDLQTVVRSACNSERIVFSFCCIHCSLGLDFGADLSYNTKYLSFQSWGSMSTERTTDWKVDPSKFSLIVDAICSSGLKTSLQKISIAYNETLSVTKIQEEMNIKGMSHISVIKDDSDLSEF